MVLSGFPWATLGYAQHANTALLGLAPFTGVYGLSWVTVLGGAALAELALAVRRGAVIQPAMLDPVIPGSEIQPVGRGQIEGAEEHCLPRPYRDRLAATESIDDPDRERSARELSIYAFGST